MLYLKANWSFLQAVSKLWTWFNDGFDELGVPGDLGTFVPQDTLEPLSILVTLGKLEPVELQKS